MDIYLDALGTVTPQQTVNIYSQVSGHVLSVNYREGQIVQKGQTLVEIDSRPLQAQLQQALGTLARDKASLAQARINLKRYQDAYAEKAVAQQTVFDQEATVQQDEGSVQNDEGSVEYDKVQLSYCHIVAPLSGRIGLRLIDTGNVIFSGSSSTIATITQLNPITTVFSIAEDHIPQVQQQLSSRKQGLSVDVYDRAQVTKLATGKLLTLDNQVDTSTGTVRLRAIFNNSNNTLFPNQFVISPPIFRYRRRICKFVLFVLRWWVELIFNNQNIKQYFENYMAARAVVRNARASLYRPSASALPSPRRVRDHRARRSFQPAVPAPASNCRSLRPGNQTSSERFATRFAKTRTRRR